MKTKTPRTDAFINQLKGWSESADKIAAIERDKIVERLCATREQIAREQGFWIGVAVTVLIVGAVMIGRAAL